MTLHNQQADLYFNKVANILNLRSLKSDLKRENQVNRSKTDLAKFPPCQLNDLHAVKSPWQELKGIGNRNVSFTLKPPYRVGTLSECGFEPKNKLKKEKRRRIASGFMKIYNKLHVIIEPVCLCL